MQLEAFEAEIQGLSYQACPPVGLFNEYREWIEAGKRVKSAYSNVMRTAQKNELGELTDKAYAMAAEATQAVLAQYDDEIRLKVLLGTALYCYSVGFNKDKQPYAGDQVLWQLGTKADETAVRNHGIAQQFIEALRLSGLLTKPTWIDGGMFHQVNDVELVHSGTIVRVNAVWFNYLNTCQCATGNDLYETMGQVEFTLRRTMKRKMKGMASSVFTGLGLKLISELVEDEQRVVAYTELGNQFGLVDRWYNIEPGQYKMAWATAGDGNIYGILNVVE